jgi:hypothetical protein
MFENTVTFSQLGNYGRLGNQLFQIASTIGVAIKSKLNYVFPENELINMLGTGIPVTSSLPKARIYKYDSITYSDFTLTHGQLWDMQGYFQSEKYFKHCEELIRKYFVFPEYNMKRGSCAVHVRRGDYLSYPNVFHELRDGYYTPAMDMFSKGTPFYIFSDDIDWCKRFFDTDKYNIEFVENNSPFVDISMMTNCKNIIMSNSSFAWWAAYLNKNKNKKVVFPKNYVKNEDPKDLYVEGWIKL